MFNAISGVSVNPQYNKAPVSFGDFTMDELNAAHQSAKNWGIGPDGGTERSTIQILTDVVPYSRDGQDYVIVKGYRGIQRQEETFEVNDRVVSGYKIIPETGRNLLREV